MICQPQTTRTIRNQRIVLKTALIVTRGLEIDEDILEAAKRHERVLISSERNTTRFINKISNYLDNRLAPHITIHGVLVDVYGIGILITGEMALHALKKTFETEAREWLGMQVWVCAPALHLGAPGLSILVCATGHYEHGLS